MTQLEQKFVERFGPEPPRSNSEAWYEWNGQYEGYVVGREVALQALRELPGDEEEQRIVDLAMTLKDGPFNRTTDALLFKQAATDLTTLLDTVKVLRLRIAELEAKEEPNGR